MWNGQQAPTPAFAKWAQSIPTNLSEADLVAWMKANPAPPKFPSPVSEAVAEFIVDEVKRQVAAALAKPT